MIAEVLCKVKYKSSNRIQVMHFYSVSSQNKYPYRLIDIGLTYI